jgi:predicted metalloprotease with PDZ domain
MIGKLTPEKVWGDLVRDIPQGLPGAGDQGLNATHTWGRTYWGGALFCLIADIEIRKRSDNRKGLRDALIAVNQAGGTIEVDWPLERVIEIGDKATGTAALDDLYKQMAFRPVMVDLPDLWNQLGVARSPTAVTFDNGAPLAAIRKSISG